jgi:hypothetical protein
MADDKIGKLGMMLDLPPLAGGKVEPEGDMEPAEEVDAETEAYRAAASELLAAIESKSVDGLAAALRAAVEAGYGAEMSESD